MNLTTGRHTLSKTTAILDLLKAKLGSDYKSAQRFDTRPSHISGIRLRGTVLSDEFGLIAAEILGLPEDFILLSLAAERALNSDTMIKMMAIADRHIPPNMDEIEHSLLDPEKKTGTHS
jgi:hypothetical protein